MNINIYNLDADIIQTARASKVILETHYWFRKHSKLK